MQWHKITIRPLSPFATALRGDTLFGQLCWAMREQSGNTVLEQALQGYGQGKPFLVVSDAFPTGFLPRPSVPGALLGINALNANERKAMKRKRWMPVNVLTQPVINWHHHLLSDADISNQLTGQNQSLQSHANQPHNTINRLTGTTGTDAFAPFTLEQQWLNLDIALDVYALTDPDIVSTEVLQGLVTAIGLTGYGKEASTGSGRFAIQSIECIDRPGLSHSASVLTLAPCAPQGQHWQADHCYYQTFTRFGRHGSHQALTHSPFKNPVMLADTGAILCHSNPNNTDWVGQGLGGQGEISLGLPETVHQGYAPAIGVTLS